MYSLHEARTLWLVRKMPVIIRTLSLSSPPPSVVATANKLSILIMSAGLHTIGTREGSNLFSTFWLLQGKNDTVCERLSSIGSWATEASVGYSRREAKEVCERSVVNC